MIGAAAAMAADAAPIAREGGIPTDKAAPIAVIRRMPMRTDAGPVFWWFCGRNFAQQGAKLIPNAPYGSAQAFGTDVTDYARWWKMPAGLCSQTLRSAGKKVARYEDMPEDWRTMTAKADLAMAADPMGVLKLASTTYRN